MKRRFFLLPVLLISFYGISIAAMNKSIPEAGSRHILIETPYENQDQSVLLWGYVFSMESTEVKKMKMEEDGRHLVFHFERIRKMRRGFSLCCLSIKVLLGMVHTALMLQLFLHLCH